ncbi:MAG: hypothetical protein R3185_04315, partial [Candidatus Thermoplasmatota archaeon]|nr:hypothetical protein [Candidatus Thermoplasmatota archaeon]
MPPTEPEHRDMREVDGFTILKAAEAGRLPEELQDSLEDLAEAVASVQQDPKGVVGMRYGRRIVVAPVDDPDQAVDVADVDLARHVILTLGGK